MTIGILVIAFILIALLLSLFSSHCFCFVERESWLSSGCLVGL